MRVFISWSGVRSKAVAEALRTWLPSMLQAVRPWLSARDIGSGRKWGFEISKALAETNFGIICLTPENLTEPWIYYESGALAKSVDESRVVPYLFGGISLSDLSSPLGDFQGRVANRDGTRQLVADMNGALGERKLDDAVWIPVFEAMFPNLENALRCIPVPADSPKVKRSPSEIAEESLELLRDLARQVSALNGRIPGNEVEHGIATWEHLEPELSSLESALSDDLANTLVRRYQEAPTNSVSRNALSRALVEHLATRGVPSRGRISHFVIPHAVTIAFDRIREIMDSRGSAPPTVTP